MKRVLVAIALAWSATSAAEAALVLDGLERSAEVRTDLELENHSRRSNRCSVALADAAGEAVAPRLSFTLRPREHRSFADVFEHLVEPAAGIAGASATVDCARRFAAHASLVDGEERATRIDGLLREAAVLQEAAPPVCPAGADCFDSPGLVFEATEAKPTGRVVFPPPPGTARRLLLSLEVTVDDWFPGEPHGKHLIYWFVIDRNFFMPGMLYFRGPNTNQAFARHGVGLTHPQKIKVIKPFAAQVGHTYRVVNDYDMAAGTLKITIQDLAGGPKLTLRGKPNVDSFELKTKSRLLVDMGFVPGVTPTEVPSFGWKFRNVHLEAYLE